VSIDTRELQRRLRALSDGAREQVPFALSKAVNEVAYQWTQHEHGRMTSIFDRPKGIVQRPLRVAKRATKRDLEVVVGIKDKLKPWAGGVFPQHIPDRPPTRLMKGLERFLAGRGLLSAGQVMVPSREMRLDQYGNVSRAAVNKMIAGMKQRGGPYFFATIQPKTRTGTPGKPVTGIWKRKGKRGLSLVMVAVDSAHYSKRWDIYGHAARYINRTLTNRVLAEVERAMQDPRRR
jgi:hypothetical protein